jgi:hypothetical protein
MVSRTVARLLLAFASGCLLGACGSGDELDTTRPVTVIPAPDRRSPTLKAGTRRCGAIPVRDGATDYPQAIRATGVDCRTARVIARAVTIESSQTPLNFVCRDALDNDDLQKHCTKGSLEVTWEIHVQ